MMALGSSSGVGGPSSSSSNLSASAPPFTIDQFSSNSNSNPVLQYADTSYAAPFGHNWQYTPIPSAPQPNQQEVGGDSTRTSSIPVPTEYSFFGPGSVNPSSTQWPALDPCDAASVGGFYVSEARPYHSPIMYPVVSGESSSLSLNRPMYDQSSIHVASRGDYSEHFPGVSYTPHWQGMWKGELSHGNQIGSGGGFANEKLNESSPFVYKKYIDEGPVIQSGEASRGDSGILYGSDGVQTGSHAGSFHRGIPDGKSLFSKDHDDDTYANPIDGTEKYRCAKSFNIVNIDGRSKSFNMSSVDGESLYSQNLGHFESSGTQFPGPTLSFPEFSPVRTFQESSKCFVNNQTTYGSQESSIQPRGPFVNDPISPMKPECPVVNKSATNKTSAARDTDKIVGNRIANNCGSKLWDIPHMSEEKGYFMSTRPESTEGSCYTNKTDKEGNYWDFFASTSKGEVPTNSQLEDPVDFVRSNKPAPQVSDPSVSYGFSPSFDHVQSYKYTEDALENHILALDSPCWKGSQVSYSSHNNFTESLPGIQFLKDLDGCLDIPGNHVGPSIVDFQDLSIGNAKFRTECAAKDEVPAQTNISESSCAAKELNPEPAAKELNCPYSGSSKDGQFLSGSENHRKVCNLSNILLGNETKYSCSNQCNMKKGFAPVEVNLHAGIQDGVTSCNEAADAGSVAYHAAENVLYSPPAQEVFEENYQSSRKEVTQILDISALVEAIHGIAEVLHSHCPADSSVLTEQNQQSLKHVIRNLDACLPKKIGDSSPVSEFMGPQQSTSISTGDRGDLSKAKGATQPHQNYQATTASCGELSHPKINNEKINYFDYDRQARSLPYFLASEQDKCISSDDKMVQAIKKVLDENFNFEEEMQSQVLLFKNLWLEAEAKLCSISYRAHFDHMRILMDGYKLNKGKGSADDEDKVSISKDSPRVEDTSFTSFFMKNGALLEGRITNQSSSSVDTIVDDANTSLFPRFNASMLHSDGFSPDEQQRSGIPRKTEGRFESVITPDAVGHVEDFGAEVLARLAILKQRDDKLNEVPQQLNVLDTDNSDPIGIQSGSSLGTSNPEFQVNHAEATLLARLNILKQRDDKPNEVQQQPNVHDANNLEAAVLARLNILRREVRSSAEEHQNVDTRKAEGQLDPSIFGYGYESWKDFTEGAMDDQVIGSDRNSNQNNSAGSHNSSSSEWEHIQNEDISWQKADEAKM